MQRKFGIGIVVRNHDGQLLHYGSLLCQGEPPPKEAEALALAEALKWIRDKQLGATLVETDCQQLHQALMRTGHDDTEFGRITAECKLLLMHQPLTEVSWVRRECNIVADAIAKRAIHMVDPVHGTTSPDWMLTLLEDICPTLDH
ncbi:hypothetical protein LINPERPRIM_LOCUS5244 [Linum perenne]